MKKCFSLLLALLMLLGLAACGGASGEDANAAGGAQAASGTLQIGYARVDITPEGNVEMAIYGAESERISTGFMDPLYGYALAVTGSNGETVLLLTCDHTWFPDKIANEMRRVLSAEFGLKEENIVCTGTHNHSGVTLKATTRDTSRYHEDFSNRMLQAARKAMADRSDAALYAGSAKASIALGELALAESTRDPEARTRLQALAAEWFQKAEEQNFRCFDKDVHLQLRKYR